MKNLISTFSAGSSFELPDFSLSLLHSVSALKVQLFVDKSNTRPSLHSYERSINFPSSGAHLLKREQLFSSADQPSLSQVFSSGEPVVVVDEAVVVVVDELVVVLASVLVDEAA